MITRRSFLAALSCLPFVGKLVPQRLVHLPDRWAVVQPNFKVRILPSATVPRVTK